MGFHGPAAIRTGGDFGGKLPARGLDRPSMLRGSGDRDGGRGKPAKGLSTPFSWPAGNFSTTISLVIRFRFYHRAGASQGRLEGATEGDGAGPSLDGGQGPGNRGFPPEIGLQVEAAEAAGRPVVHAQGAQQVGKISVSDPDGASKPGRQQLHGAGQADLGLGGLKGEIECRF